MAFLVSLVSAQAVSETLRRRRFEGLVKMLERRLVATEHDVVLGAGIKPALDAFGHWEILIFDSGHQQIEIIVPMPSCAVG